MMDALTGAYAQVPRDRKPVTGEGRGGVFIGTTTARVEVANMPSPRPAANDGQHMSGLVGGTGRARSGGLREISPIAREVEIVTHPAAIVAVGGYSHSEIGSCVAAARQAPGRHCAQ